MMCAWQDPHNRGVAIESLLEFALLHSDLQFLFFTPQVWLSTPLLACDDQSAHILEEILASPGQWQSHTCLGPETNSNLSRKLGQLRRLGCAWKLLGSHLPSGLLKVLRMPPART